MSPRLRLLLAAILVSLFLGAADCDGRDSGTLVCQDGTVTSGQGAHEVCAEHGGVA